MGRLQGCLLIPILPIGVKGDQCPRIYQSPIRQHECDGILSQVHQAIKVCIVHGCRPKSKDEQVHLWSVRIGVQGVQSHHSSEGGGYLLTHDLC